MSRSLVIVESPAKAKTINRYLGNDYKVLASYGHVRDLLRKTGAIDTENGFEMKYQDIEKNAKAVDAIIKALKNADTLYLATDPDREGEAIAWHLHELLKERGLLEGKKSHRVVFHEVTKNAIKEAVANPRELSIDLINAQQARRALDYLVGFNLSPLLWKKIQPGLSAGRVQSPALRMIVEREQEIDKFEAQEYWTIEADVEKERARFVSRLTYLHGEKLKQFTITEADTAHKTYQELLQAANGSLTVSKVEKKQRKRQPTAPFITSTMQQEAVRKLGLTAQRNMRVAQQLYEGIDIGGDEGTVGLITFMRTDFFALGRDAQDEIREFIGERYGKNNVPEEHRVYKTKSKNAQEVHEAIRPTTVRHVPSEIKSSVDADQFKLYELIWKRTVASQMIHATIDTVAVDMDCGEGNIFRANGSTIADPGFMMVYLEGQDEAKQESDEKLLPALKQGDVVKLLEIRPEQHFTEPPPRFTEASLVKTLEEYGIGRPSTYASIIHTLKHRGYVEFEQKRFTPTDVGRVVNNFLTTHFMDYVDYDFTARLEDELDAVSRGEKEWLPLLKIFWETFEKQIKEKEETVSRSEAIQARELGTDPKTGSPVSVRIGRFGPFAQIGTKEDEDKPKFAGLLPGQKLDSITLEEALALFKLPRELGETEEGEDIIVSAGRFGPYIRYGSKFVSLKEDDPYTVGLERCLQLIIAKKIEDAEKQINIFEEEGISVLNGRYGPYVTDGNKNVKVPKDVEPADLSVEDCQKMIAEAPDRPRRGAKKKASNKKATKKKTTRKKTEKKKTAKKPSEMTSKTG